MAGEKGKVITTLRKRREVEAEIRRMLESPDEGDFLARAAHIATYGRQVIPVILHHLNTADAHLLGVLGTIATYLDTEEVAQALRKVATGAGYSDHERMAALMILDRFLHQELDEELFAALRNPQEVAMQSLAEMLDEAEKNPFILLEYIRALEEQPIEVVQAIVEAMRGLDRERAVEPLRLLAQDERPLVAERAIRTLSTIRLPQAARALQTLLPTVRPQLRPLVERSLRKLRLSGVPLEALPPAAGAWRTLISPPDGGGNQSVWFIDERPPGRFLNLLLNDVVGMRAALGGVEGGATERLPPRTSPGTIHALFVPESNFVLTMLEADFDYGRRLVLESLIHNWESGIPVPAQYRLLNDLLWGQDYSGVAQSEKLPPLERMEALALLPLTGLLLDHPAFSGWPLQNELVYYHAARILARNEGRIEPKGFIRNYFDREALTLYRARLKTISEWLLRAGEEHLARLALAAALTVGLRQPVDHPLFRRLAEQSLELALEQLGAATG